MKTIKLLALALAIPALLGPVNTASGQDTRSQKEARTTEAYLTKEVRHELVQIPWYSVFDILQYTVNGNEVTLTGQVVQPTIKSDAENSVKHIEGVEKVNNQIEVLPTSPMDDQLRRAEYRAIYSQPNLFRYGVGNLQSIHIIVKNGRVTLEGAVESEQDRNVAAIAANGVSNVFSVENHLKVEASK
ncbi:MAG: BON domain-containing protein [Acidobacteriia bacterium]|nr:BON domain-containing protein [Terriglobia bacterium]